jgi:hypothetical protein
MDLICFIFACFCVFANTIYSHHSLHVRFKIFAKVRMQIFASKYSFWSNYSQNSKRISHSSEHSLANFTYKRMFACKYLHTSQYSLSIAKQANKTCFSHFEANKSSLHIRFIFASNRISRRTLGAILYLLELKGERGGRSVALFYCLILSASSYTGKVYLEKMDPSNLWKNKATLSLFSSFVCAQR